MGAYFFNSEHLIQIQNHNFLLLISDESYDMINIFRQCPTFVGKNQCYHFCGVK